MKIFSKLTFRLPKQLTISTMLVASLITSSVPIVSAQDNAQDSASHVYLPVVTDGKNAANASSTSPQESNESGRPIEEQQQVPEEFYRIALQRVSERTGIPVDQLFVVNATVVTFSFQSVQAFGFKVFGPKEDVYAVGLDEQGNEIDLSALNENELSLYNEKYGRIDPLLHEEMATSPADQPIEVIIHVLEKEYTGPQRPLTDEPLSQEQIEAFSKEVYAVRSKAVASLVQPVIEKLQQFGYKPLSADADGSLMNESVPMIIASLLPDQIREVANWEEIERIYPTVELEAMLDVARLTSGADAVQSYGINGSNQRVAVVEVGGGVNLSNPYLAGVYQDPIGSCLHPHAAAVTGIIRSTHPLHKGIAPAANVWVGGDCTGSLSGIMNATNRAKSWGARVVNLSLGSRATGFTALDPFYDDLVRNSYITIVPAAGNEGLRDRQVRSPGLAHNVITVGSFDDQNTVGWGGDTMAGYSSWLEFSGHGDRELPIVTASGSNINSTVNGSPWIGGVGSGTSYAAPMVTGEVALLFQRHGSLAIWPESTKAIVMTSAVHNIEGSTRLSEYDGAGGIDIAKASEIAANRNVSTGVKGSWDGISYTCSAPSTQNVATMSLTAGTRTRASIVWDNAPNYSAAYANGVARPSADLDLSILGPSGGYITGSASWDNTSEIVDFVAPSTGNYTIQVVKFRCDSSPDWLGWAWQTYQ